MLDHACEWGGRGEGGRGGSSSTHAKGHARMTPFREQGTAGREEGNAFA